ncbi:COP9 signalosome complex subunit 8 [Prorops nasuta]|uniref:COP9 signalosome complex subunit 8 n=1 Tax=Prorops nasuta TaxID=863751 RepID=UPI0034CD97C3
MADLATLIEKENLLHELEKAELEAPGGVASAQTYAQLLAVYLYENDLCNAKYLWKRIPSNVKAANAELGQIWIVGKRMWQRDWSAVHIALDGKWSSDVGYIMAEIREKVRERAMNLIAEAYSSLELSVLASMTGLSIDGARQAAASWNWRIDGTTVQTRKMDMLQHYSNLAPESALLTEDQLEKLTQIVSFLEN